MRRSPQDKKALSYALDRRNLWPDNDKSARKNIPLRKRLVNRANRHAAQQQLRQVAGTPPPSAPNGWKSGCAALA